MKKILSILALAALLAGSTFAQKDIYPFKVTDIDGNTHKMKQHKGKVVLVVNVASRCGLTPQYEGLEALYEKYHSRGLDIVAFPCNQFLGQEPGDNDEIKGFCSANYGVSFPIMDKVDVNGPNAAPIYVWLRSQAPFKGYPEQYADFGAQLDMIHQKTGTGYDQGDAVRWNFGKFLINRKGQVAQRIEPMVAPQELEALIEQLLAE